MTPLSWIFVGLIICGIILGINDFEKNPGKQTKKRHYRSFKSPVASNAELFDAFQNEPETKEDTSNCGE